MAPPGRSLRILVVGDDFVPVAVFAEAFAELAARHAIQYVQLASGPGAATSVSRISEFLGDPQDVRDRMTDVDVLLVHCAPVTAGVLDGSECLGLVGCARGGPVNVDVDAASARRIPVVTTPGKNAVAVAELTVAFLVMLARGIPRALRFVAGGAALGTSAFEGAGFLGDELPGRVLGLVGFGNVARLVAPRARALGLTVAVFDPYVTPDPDDAVVRVDTMHELLAMSDFVSDHARLHADTENLFDRSTFESMKAGAYFVNTARELLVDEQALDEALQSGRVAGAALDVVRPHAGGLHPLLRHGNVVITPHIAGATHETLRRGARMLADEVGRFERGDALVHVVNREVLEA